MKELDKVIDYLAGIYKNLPPLPKGFTDFIVLVLPWITLIFGVLGVIGTLTAMGVVGLGGGIAATTGFSISVVVNLVANAVSLVAVPSLFSKKILGWKLLFLSELLGIVAAVFSISIFGVLFALIWIYFLFQVKSYYK